jgi:flavin-dependent dehydrogenase
VSRATVDVLVVGGGPAGAAAAAGARAEGLDVELMHAGPGKRPTPGESLPPGTQAVLDDIFGHATLDPERHRPSFGNRSAWGQAALEATDFMNNPFGHGWHVDRRALDRSLLERVRLRGVRVSSGARVADQTWAGDVWRVRLADPSRDTMLARAIVDATGRAARIARSQGARRRRLDHLVAAYWMLPVGGEPDRDSTTLVEAVADGWWYTTPVPGNRRVVAFLTDSDLLPGRRARTARHWQERVVRAPHIRDTLISRGCELYGNPVLVDAGVAHLEQPAGRAWLAAGDAAVSVDPLSSQGILTALVMGHAGGGAVAAMLIDGDQQALIEWGREYARLLENHLRLRAASYAMERRWPSSPFWARRHGPT